MTSCLSHCAWSWLAIRLFYVLRFHLAVGVSIKAKNQNLQFAQEAKYGICLEKRSNFEEKNLFWLASYIWLCWFQQGLEFCVQFGGSFFRVILGYSLGVNRMGQFWHWNVRLFLLNIHIQIYTPLHQMFFSSLTQLHVESKWGNECAIHCLLQYRTPVTLTLAAFVPHCVLLIDFKLYYRL